jgi:two-component system repressor protein LuxO
MDLDLQTKLLRFIQTGRFQKVGGKKEEEVDVRFVCATNKDPMEYVKAGKFREDLYYRLHVLPISMPALCERDEDVILIAKYFLKTFAQEEKKEFVKFDNDVLNVFRKYKWPGNVRQLQNVVRNIVVLNRGDSVSHSMLPAPLNQLSADDYYMSPPKILNQQTEDVPVAALHNEVSNVTSHLSPEMAQGLLFGRSAEELTPLDVIERKLIEHALRLCDQNVQTAAHYLGVSTATIYRKKSAWDKESA